MSGQTAVAAEREHVRQVVSVRVLVTSALFVMAIAGLAFLMFRLLSILLIFLVGVVIAEGIRSGVERFERWRFPRPLAILTVYIILLSLLALAITLLVQPLVSEATSLAHNVPTYQRNIEGSITNLQNQFNVKSNVGAQAAGFLGSVGGVLLTIGQYIASIVINFFIVLVVGFMWLMTTDRLKAFVVDLFPPNRQPLVAGVVEEIGTKLGGYVRATVLNMVVVGVATGLASWALHLPEPLLLGMFAGLSAAIPIIGPFLGMVPAVALGLTISVGWALLTALILGVVQLVDANTAVPLLMNRIVSLPALAVMLSLLIGATLAGVLGALLAVPVAMAIQVVIVRVAVPQIHAAQGRGES